MLDPVCHTLEEHIRLLTLPSSDGARMRNELDKVRAMLEESFTRSHQQALLNVSISESSSTSETLAGPSLSLQLDVQALLTGGPNGTKDDPAGAKILQLI